MLRFTLATLALALNLSAQAAPLAAWSPQTDDHPSTVALRGFLEKVQQVTGGEAAEVLPVTAGKDQKKLLADISKGDVGAAVITAGIISRVAPMAKVMTLPFIMRNSRQMFGLLDGQVGQDMTAKLDAAGMVVLGWYDGGSRAIYSRDKLGSIGALKDVKIRIPGRRDLSNLVSSLGGKPLELAYKEVNGAFEAGKIDAAENDLLSYETEGHYKRARYFYLNNNHVVQFEALVVSKVWWNKLSAAQREGLRKAGLESASHDRDLWSQRMAKARTRLEKEGVKFVEYGDSSMLLSRLTPVYRPYMDNPETRDLMIRLMTTRI
ncbi:TRAP transporter substrate-binding protein DctP [Uliginosibacterium paludis]|uniref:TRAP transporter substrate-binding protein DctP n=1 Tax=Uliginosibacterium paludis TaxID=1615952 RepID=A0ABV2CRR8_9RHOO